MHEPRVLAESETSLSPWVTLVARTIEDAEKKPQTYHSFNLADYVAIFAVTSDGKIPCVRQYRPARKEITLEFPAGMLEKGEEPHVTAMRELFEETGFRSSENPILLSRLNADTGRLSNDLWCFFSSNVRADEPWKREASVERVVLSKPELFEALRDGSFRNAMHMALLASALITGHFEFGDVR
jgi:8-oxo-dGTP pyrophosphatase MutT (NUDIX family)